MTLSGLQAARWGRNDPERPAGREVGEPYPWSGLQAARRGCHYEGGVIKLSP